MKKHTFTNSQGETFSIFKGKGYSVEYVDHKKHLPLLNYKNEWDSGNIRLTPIDATFRGEQFQLYMKQHRLEYWFGFEIDKNDLVDDSFAVAFYQYKNPMNKKIITTYAVISLEEFLNRYEYKIKLPLMLDNGLSIEDLRNSIEEKKVELEKEKQEQLLSSMKEKLWQKRIEELRKDNIVYEIIEHSKTFYDIKRYTKASYKRHWAKSEKEVDEIISNLTLKDNDVNKAFVIENKNERFEDFCVINNPFLTVMPKTDDRVNN